MPQVTTSTRGRGRAYTKACISTPRDGAHATTHAHARAVFENPTIALEVDKILDQVIPPLPAQVPKGFIITPVFQDTMVRIRGYFDYLAQAVMIFMVLATSQAGWGAQTPVTHFSEQDATIFQTLGVPIIPLVGIVQPIAIARLVVRPAMSVDEQKKMDQFQNLDPPHFDCDPTINAQNFLDMCHEILCNLGLVESNRVEFTTFQLRGPAKRQWQAHE